MLKLSNGIGCSYTVVLLACMVMLLKVRGGWYNEHEMLAHVLLSTQLQKFLTTFGSDSMMKWMQMML